MPRARMSPSLPGCPNPASGDAQLTLPIFDAAGTPAVPSRRLGPSATAQRTTAAEKPTPRRRAALPRTASKAGDPLDPVDVLLRDFARALIATARHVHDDMAASGLLRTQSSKYQSTQGKSRVQRVVVGRPDVVSSEPQNNSGAAPLATADPVVPNRSRRLET